MLPFTSRCNHCTIHNLHHRRQVLVDSSRIVSRNSTLAVLNCMHSTCSVGELEVAANSSRSSHLPRCHGRCQVRMFMRSILDA